MATKKKAEPQEEKPAKAQKKEAAAEEILQKAAKAIDTVAVKTGIAHPATPPKKKIPKLVKKAKSRLPRKEKKQLLAEESKWRLLVKAITGVLKPAQ